MSTPRVPDEPAGAPGSTMPGPGPSVVVPPGRAPAPAPAPGGPARPDASMSLLVEAAMNPVDGGYAEAAARREHEHADVRRTPAGVALVGLLAAMLGTGTVWAARELRAPQPDVLQARMLLESEIQGRTDAVLALQHENASVAAEVDDLSAQALVGAGAGVFETATLLGLVSGTSAVHGPGLAVTLTDSALAAGGDPAAADGRVQDVDLQIITNGLWSAGAEAMAINGERLTSLTAIRSAGEAILVDLTPLVGPYRIEVIGDPQAMQVGLARTSATRHIALLRDTYGIGTQISVEEDLTLPASPVPTLRYAESGVSADTVAGSSVPDVSPSAKAPGENP